MTQILITVHFYSSTTCSWPITNPYDTVFVKFSYS